MIDHKKIRIMEVERDQHKPPLSLQNNKIPSSQNFPVVDLSNTNGELVARKVAKASEEWGIFQVVNHGIPTELIRRLHKVDTQFFELPESKKEAVAKPANSKEIQGYEMDDVQGRRSHIFHNLYPSSSVNYAFWPKNPPEYRLYIYIYIYIYRWIKHFFFFYNLPFNLCYDIWKSCTYFIYAFTQIKQRAN